MQKQLRTLAIKWRCFRNKKKRICGIMFYILFKMATGDSQSGLGIIVSFPATGIRQNISQAVESFLGKRDIFLKKAENYDIMSYQLWNGI